MCAVAEIARSRAGVAAQSVVIVKDAGDNATTFPITSATEGAETIDGQASVAIAADSSARSLYSDGSNLFIY